MKTSQPLVSIVIPLYNKESVIERTISSILSQTYTHFEIIVVDDGSTDKSLAVVLELSNRDSRISVIKQKNSGPGHARNTGLKNANGELVSFLDADDEHMPTFLETAIATFNEHSDLSIYASSHYRTLHGQKKDFAPYFKHLGVKNGKFRVNEEIDTHALLGMVWFHHSSTVVCKTETALKYGGFYDKTKCLYGEDTYLWLRMILNESGYCDLRPLGWYHIEDSDLCAAGTIFSDIPIFLEHPDQIRKHCPDKLLPKIEELFTIFTLLEMFKIFENCRVDMVKLANAKSSSVNCLPVDKSDAFNDSVLSYVKDLTSMHNSRELMKMLEGPDEGGPWN
jgi:glycosyltransferase involved in cell wall biosynthesis